MNRLRMLGFVAATVAASVLAASAPAADAAASAKVTGSVSPIARSCTTPRIAHFRIALRHLVAGKRYTVEWSAPTRSAGEEITQIAIIPKAARYVVADQKSRAATPLLRRQFPTTITLLVQRKSGEAQLMQSTATVPACTPRR